MKEKEVNRYLKDEFEIGMDDIQCTLKEIALNFSSRLENRSEADIYSEVNNILTSQVPAMMDYFLQKILFSVSKSLDDNFTMNDESVVSNANNMTTLSMNALIPKLQNLHRKLDGQIKEAKRLIDISSKKPHLEELPISRRKRLNKGIQREKAMHALQDDQLTIANAVLVLRIQANKNYMLKLRTAKQLEVAEKRFKGTEYELHQRLDQLNRENVQLYRVVHTSNNNQEHEQESAVEIVDSCSTRNNKKNASSTVTINAGRSDSQSSGNLVSHTLNMNINYKMPNKNALNKNNRSKINTLSKIPPRPFTSNGIPGKRISTGQFTPSSRSNFSSNNFNPIATGRSNTLMKSLKSSNGTLYINRITDNKTTNMTKLLHHYSSSRSRTRSSKTDTIASKNNGIVHHSNVFSSGGVRPSTSHTIRPQNYQDGRTSTNTRTSSNTVTNKKFPYRKTTPSSSTESSNVILKSNKNKRTTTTTFNAAASSSPNHNNVTFRAGVTRMLEGAFDDIEGISSNQGLTRENSSRNYISSYLKEENGW